MNRYTRANEALHTPPELKRALLRKKPRRSPWIAPTAAATALAILLVVLFLPVRPGASDTPVSPFIPVASAAERLTAPEYPQSVPAPDWDDEWDQDAYNAWRESRRRQWNQRPEDDAALHSFYTETARQYLSGAGEENVLYSPLNLYLSLSMLAELTAGETRTQILDALNHQSLEDLREFAGALWNVNYCDDGQVTSLLASSLWLREDTQYRQETIQALADYYYASSYRGVMGSEELNRAFRGWMNENTGNLLSDQIDGLELDANTVLALVSTIYFKAAWTDEFSPEATAEDIFHAPGGDVTAPFLNQKTERNYYWGEDFSAVSLPLADSGQMWFLLPDEDSTVDALLEGNALELVIDPSAWENQEYLTVDLSIPKFDVSSQISLDEGLRAMGITDAFDWQKADFSPVCENSDGMFLSSAIHGARVAIDEEGCIAAAYTVLKMDVTGAGPEYDTVEFTADRPFLFAITGWDGQILFLGVVNTP